ncbi:Ribosomal_S17e domain-containing protein [Cephalotus follicularis]|uniref:Ribosomal_S17e domain-containing protein n=1 Tax=Cephalotus follicularis TaxID=3775 RepID=A0A1Q3CI57_CEPFO|nr:Ribosomal_S17e domain-containing protein [Cephalotus follicularis]
MTLDFNTNKKILGEVAIIPSKQFSTQDCWVLNPPDQANLKGPTSTIPLKLQEDEREHHMDFVPEESAIKIEEIKVDKEDGHMGALLHPSNLAGELQPVCMPGFCQNDTMNELLMPSPRGVRGK